MTKGSDQAGGSEAMGMATFLELLEQYGAETRRWPEGLRQQATLLLSQSPAARMELHRAAALDAALDTVMAPDISDARVARVVAGALADLPVPGLVKRRRPFGQRVGEWLGSVGQFWPKATGLAACTMAGLAVGMITPVNTPATTATVATTHAVATVQVASTDDLASSLFTPSAFESLFQ